MKLDTAEKILEALEKFCHADASGEREVWFSKGVDPLAERLAYCVRVTELVEEGGTDFDTYSGMILRQAAQKGQIDEGVP